jgi:multicomponent Na+:H+ antiporter subunit E
MKNPSVILLHTLAALVWLFLSEKPSLTSFFTGIVIGLLLLWCFGDLFGAKSYLRRWTGAAAFVFAFTRAFLESNATIAWAVLTRKRKDIHPRFLTYDVSHLKGFEVLLLSHCVTLTPGTTTVEISDDGKELILHAFDGDDPEAVRKSIRDVLETPILRFTR